MLAALSDTGQLQCRHPVRAMAATQSRAALLLRSRVVHRLLRSANFLAESYIPRHLVRRPAVRHNAPKEVPGAAVSLVLDVNPTVLA